MRMSLPKSSPACAPVSQAGLLSQSSYCWGRIKNKHAHSKQEEKNTEIRDITSFTRCDHRQIKKFCIQEGGGKEKESRDEQEGDDRDQPRLTVREQVQRTGFCTRNGDYRKVFTPTLYLKSFLGFQMIKQRLYPNVNAPTRVSLWPKATIGLDQTVKQLCRLLVLTLRILKIRKWLSVYPVKTQTEHHHLWPSFSLETWFATGQYVATLRSLDYLRHIRIYVSTYVDSALGAVLPITVAEWGLHPCVLAVSTHRRLHD